MEHPPTPRSRARSRPPGGCALRTRTGPPPTQNACTVPGSDGGGVACCERAPLAPDQDLQRTLGNLGVLRQAKMYVVSTAQPSAGSSHSISSSLRSINARARDPVDRAVGPDERSAGIVSERMTIEARGGRNARPLTRARSRLHRGPRTTAKDEQEESDLPAGSRCFVCQYGRSCPPGRCARSSSPASVCPALIETPAFGARRHRADGVTWPRLRVPGGC